MIPDDLLLLYRALQDPPQRAVVAMDRRRRDPRGDLVVEPVLDLVGRQPAQSVRAETGAARTGSGHGGRCLGSRARVAGRATETPRPTAPGAARRRGDR